MLHGLWFDMGVDLYVRVQKGNYVLVRFFNQVSMCLCIVSPSQRGINNPLYVYMYVCIYECMYVYLYAYDVWCVCVCLFVCASMYVCMYSFTCGWIYGVGVKQTRYLTWKMQYRLQVMVK